MSCSDIPDGVGGRKLMEVYSLRRDNARPNYDFSNVQSVLIRRDRNHLASKTYSTAVLFLPFVSPWGQRFKFQSSQRV